MSAETEKLIAQGVPNEAAADVVRELNRLGVALAAAEARADKADRDVVEAWFQWNEMSQRAVAAEAREKQLREALQDACDVAVWLSGLVRETGEEWPYWHDIARLELSRALNVLAAGGEEPGRQQGTRVSAATICQNCGKREADTTWVGEGGTLALVHGAYEMWCGECVLLAQIDYAQAAVVRVAHLEARLADLRASRPQDERASGDTNVG